MNLFRKLGFEKNDERGIFIASKALRFAWLFNTIALFSWLVVEFIRNGPTSIFFILLILFSAGQTVFMGFYLYYLKKNSG